MTTEVLSQIQVFVELTFMEYPVPELCYHTLDHTREVVKRCDEIATHLGIDEHDHQLLLAAAWFHDIGHLFGSQEGHEERSASLMFQFVDGKISQTDAQKIEQLILATLYPPHPQTISEEIICDADMYHLGTLQFRQTNQQVHREMENRAGHSIPNWNQRSLNLLQHHHFFTLYCKQLLEAGKKQNIRYLQELLS